MHAPQTKRTLTLPGEPRGVLSVSSSSRGRRCRAVGPVSDPAFFPAESVVECPRNCHGNGECVSGSCHCFPGFLGPDCSRGTSVQSSPQVSLSKRENKYIRKEIGMWQAPYMFLFMKHWWKKLDLNLSVVLYSTAACPVLCSGNGQYSKGRCLCYSGWKGTECDVPATQCIDPQCGGRGICIMGSCACNSGYKGENCEEGKRVNIYPSTCCCWSGFQLAHPALLILLGLDHMH